MKEHLILTWIFKVLAIIIPARQWLAAIGFTGIPAYFHLAKIFLTHFILHNGIKILERSDNIFFATFHTIFWPVSFKHIDLSCLIQLIKQTKNNFLNTTFSTFSLQPKVSCPLMYIILYKSQTPNKYSHFSFFLCHSCIISKEEVKWRFSGKKGNDIKRCNLISC